MALVEQRETGAGLHRLAEVVHDQQLRHAETLLPALDDCLGKAGCALADVDGIAVSLGPGSFTGLRVGLATAQGIALATEAWLVGVPTLEAYARAHLALRQAELPSTGLIFVCLDARKAEVYSAAFRFEGSPQTLRRILPDTVESPQKARARLEQAETAAPGPLWLLGEGGERYRDEILAGRDEAGSGVSVDSGEPRERGFCVAEMGWGLYRQRGPDDPASLVPAYLRASEAELKRRRSADESGGRKTD